MPSLNFKRTVCRDLCRAVREESFEDLEVGAAKHGLKVEQAWRAPSGQGFKAAAARFTVDGEDILVVAFRSTFGNDEWLEYPQKYWKRKFLPHDGKERVTDLKVFTVWSETLDEIWQIPGEEVDRTKDTLRGLLWRQLKAGGRVWLTGHSKGGAVATTAASRLLLGDSVHDAFPPLREQKRVLMSRLSVFTFNAPMAFTIPLARLYDARLDEAGGEHMRFEQKADRVRKLPPGMEMSHVGGRKLEGEGVTEDKSVLIGGAITVVGVVAMMLAATAKVVTSHSA